MKQYLITLRGKAESLTTGEILNTIYLGHANGWGSHDVEVEEPEQIEVTTDHAKDEWTPTHYSTRDGSQARCVAVEGRRSRWENEDGDAWWEDSVDHWRPIVEPKWDRSMLAEARGDLSRIDPPPTYTLLHKATPLVDFNGATVAICHHCLEAIKQVPGGHGPVWIHSDTGCVAASGGSR